MTDLPSTLPANRATLEVEPGVARDALIFHFMGRPLLGPCPAKYRVPVFLQGFLSKVAGEEGEDGGQVYAGFEVTVERALTAYTGKEDSLEAFDVLLERTAKSYEGTARNHDIAPMFRALADRFHGLLAQERLQYSPLDWMAKDINLELIYGYPQEEGEPGCWRVYQRTGNRLDREWWVVGVGETPIAAINDAYVRGKKRYPDGT